MEIPENPDEAVDGTSISIAQDASPNVRPFRWYRDEIQNQTGVELPDGGINTFDFGGLFQQYNNEFISGNAPGDAIVYYPALLGTFAENGHLQPLDDLTEVWDPQMDDVIDRYRIMYSEWGGTQYALPMDGDVHMMLYRKDLFEKHDQDVPQTWKEFNEVARYFTEETDDVEYGTATYGHPSFGYAWFLNRFGSAGGRYFDEDMNPRFNTEAGRRALEHWQETIEYCPPDTANYAYMDVRRAFTEGRVAMSIQWNDIPKKVYFEGNVGSDWGGTTVPGWAGGDAVSLMPAGRVMSVPNYISDEKKLAAYRWIQMFDSPEFSNHTVSDIDAGQDPYRESHMNPDLFMDPNPHRDYEEKEPDESIAFTDVQEAQSYVTLTRANLKQGYPEPNWPGAPQFTEIMGTECSKFVAGEQGIDETLQNMDEKFEQAVDDLGREQQEEFYSKVVDAWKEAGIWE